MTITDPFGNYNYLVEIDGISRGAFHEVSGLDSSIEVVDHREGGQGWRKLAGQVKHSTITLKWGMTSDDELWAWHKTVVDGTVDRRNGSVVMLDRKGNEVARWNFVRAWPSKYTGPSLSAEANDVAIESLELAHEGLERVA